MRKRCLLTPFSDSSVNILYDFILRVPKGPPEFRLLTVHKKGLSLPLLCA